MIKNIDHLEPISIYLHIPFCKKICNFCDFNAYEGIDDLIDDYEVALINELAIWLPMLSNKKIVSIFIGGGTPSRLDAQKISNILTFINQSTNVDPLSEITIEVNPDDIPDWDLNELNKSGVNRLSIGIQSFQNDELELLDRAYTADFAKKQIINLKKSGFNDINLDLMFGLVNHSMENWISTLEQAIELMPTHLSCYALGVEDGTLLNYRIEKGELPSPDDDLAASQYEFTMKRLLDASFSHYEISNWSLPGMNSVHNSSYWKMQEYLGVGAGSHSFVANKRFSNIKNPREYIEKIMKITERRKNNNKVKMLQISEGEEITAETIIKEAMIFGLRMIEGISINEFYAKYKIDPRIKFNNSISINKKRGLLIESDNNIKLSQQGLLLSNEVFADII
ncbi:MAG: radical SAM family heme chaperone HemW [Dehalococcoidia bacterium]|nr:MAG: oxygen-independent coproporphyrinogen-3 oxidase [Chloroflexota bacterium]